MHIICRLPRKSYTAIEDIIMTHVTTISVKMNFGYFNEEQDGSMDPDIDTVDMIQLAGHVEGLIPALDDLQELQDNCYGEDDGEDGEGFEKVTEICMRSFMPCTWTVENERMGYELVITYRFELQIDVRHIGHDLSSSVISRIVDAFFEDGAYSSPDIPHHVSYPVHWDAAQSNSLLIDANEAIDYGDYERSIWYAPGIGYAPDEAEAANATATATY